MQRHFRFATAADAAALSALAFRSKAHWGYSDELMALWKDDLTLSESDCSGGRVGIIEIGGEPAGFYQLGGEPPVGALMDLFVSPNHMGMGAGGQLLERAKQQGRELGYTALSIHSDPHAEGFYAHRGAVVVGTVPSEKVPGRSLPSLLLQL